MLLFIAIVFAFIVLVTRFHGGFAGSIALPDRMYGFGQPDNAAVGDKAALVFDVSEVSGGTTTDGVSVTDDMAVSSFVRKPTASAWNFLAGVGEQAMTAARYGRYHAGGPVTVAIHNPTSANLALGVGDLLVMVPGQEYLEPLVVPVSAGTSQVVSNRAAAPVGFLRKAITLTTGQTTTCEAFVWPPRPPVPFCWTLNYTTMPTGTTVTAHQAFIARGPGRITGVGFGAAAYTSGTSINLDVLIAGVSCFTTLPLITDCIANFNRLKNTDAPAAGAGPGNGGVYGLLNTAANFFSARDPITFTIVNTGTWVGTGLNLQIEGVYF